MGVETIVYSIPKKKLQKLKANPELLDLLVGFEDDPDGGWTFETFDFGKRWEEAAEIFGLCGFPSFRKILNPEKYWDCDGFEVWSVTPAAAGKVARALEDADFEKIKTKAMAQNITDYWGKEISEDDYEYYVGDFDEIREFLQKAADQGNYLLFSTL